MRNLLTSVVMLVALSFIVGGCYTQLETARETKHDEPEYSENEEYNQDGGSRYNEDYDPYWSPRRTFYFHYYYPSFTVGYFPCDPWYSRYGWYYSYYDPFWNCGTYYPGYYAGWAWWHYPGYARWWYPYGWGYGGGYAGRSGHGTPRTIGVTRTEGDTRGSYGRGSGGDNALPTGYRRAVENRGSGRSGSDPAAGTRVSTGRSGRTETSGTDSRGSRGNTSTRGGNTRNSGGRESTRGGEVRTPPRPPTPVAQPPSSGGNDRGGGRSGGGRSSEGGGSYSPPARSSSPPSSSPPPSAPSNSGGRNSGGRGG